MRTRVAPAACTLAGAASPSGRSRRRRPLLCALVFGALATVPATAGADPTSTLQVVSDGNGAVTISPSPPDGTNPCVGSLRALGECIVTAAEGETVTLTAVPNPEAPDVDPPTAFVGWSDARCPGTGPCTLTMDGEPLTVIALFSPQRVIVRSAGPGTVTTPAGTPCAATVERGRSFLDCGRFELRSHVTLQANPSAPVPPKTEPVVATWEPSFCDAPAPSPGQLLCTVSVLGPTESKVGFDDKPGGARTPTIEVAFRLLKLGSGSGTVHGGRLECGSRCAVTGRFGDRQTLVADPAPGSTFAGWRGVCSRAPQCSFDVGPVTSAVAVFDRSDTSNRAPTTPDRTPASRGGRDTPFTARLGRVAVTGHGRHRRVLIRVQVDASATVTAALRRGHHRAATGRWQVRAGTPLLRLRVPAATRPGRYRLAVSLRDATGHTARLTMRVRLPR